MTTPVPTIDFDIDIDFVDRDAALACLPHVAASTVRDGKLLRHPSGVYFQPIPTDPLTGYAALTYDEAPQHGYFKIDFLNYPGPYQGVRDEAHLDELLARPVLWEAFEDEEIVKKLVQIRDHFDVVSAIKPTSVEELAWCVALIRPGKRHLLRAGRARIAAEIWQPHSDGYYYKRSHAIAYATGIIVQLAVLVEQAL